jgi:hypothetical protein
MSNKNSWRILSLSFNNKLHDAMQQQHHAAQFPALVGKYLIPQEPDDSNTNMQILPGKDILAGNRLSNGFCVALNLINLEISLLDENDSIKTGFALNGKTKQQGFSELKKILSENRIDTSCLKNELHYEIPAHKLDEGFPFVVKEKAYFEENTKQRHNAEVILKEIISTRENAAPVRVWPHHFDTGTSISLARNEQGTISSSIGLGWAIPDTMVDEPYFYLSFWSEKPVADVNKLPALKTGNWITSGWQGGVLTLSDILVETSADAQYGKVKLFFESGIEIFQTYYT